MTATRKTQERESVTLEGAAKLVEKASAGANHTIAQLQMTLDSALANLDKANRRANEAYDLLHTQARQINELQQKDLERERYLADVGLLQKRLELEGRRTDALIETAKDVGRAVVQSAVMPRLMQRNDTQDVQPQDDADRLALAVAEVLMPLSEQTRLAIQNEAGEGKVNTLLDLVLTRRQGKEK